MGTRTIVIEGQYGTKKVKHHEEHEVDLPERGRITPAVAPETARLAQRSLPGWDLQAEAAYPSLARFAKDENEHEEDDEEERAKRLDKRVETAAAARCSQRAALRGKRQHEQRVSSGTDGSDASAETLVRSAAQPRAAALSDPGRCSHGAVADLDRLPTAGPAAQAGALAGGGPAASAVPGCLRGDAARRLFSDWAALESEIAKQMRRYCRGRGREHFSARQAAADMTQVPGWVSGLGPGSRPATSRAGPGAQAVHYLAEAAVGKRTKRTPRFMDYKEQTEKCEYSKLVCRLTFPAAAVAARCTPTPGCLRPFAAPLPREIRSGAVAVAKVVRARGNNADHGQRNQSEVPLRRRRIGALRPLVLVVLLLVNALRIRFKGERTHGLPAQLLPLGAFKDEISASVEAKLGSIKTSIISEISNHSTGLVRAVAARQDAVNQHVQVQLTDLQARSDVLEHSQHEMRKQMQEMRKELHCQERAIPIKDYEDMQVWDRQPDPTVLIASLSEMASKEKVNAELSEWLSEAGVAKNQYKLIGDSPSRKYIIQMLGNSDAAQRKVRAARRALKRDAQNWRQFETDAVLGGRAKIFVGLDKSARQIRTEVQTERLASFVKYQLPNKRIKHDRAKGIVFIDSIPAITAQTGDSFESKSRLLWNYTAVTSQGVDQKALQDTFNATFNAVEVVLRFVCETAEYTEMLDELIRHSDIDRLPPIPRWRELKRLMREAAARGRQLGSCSLGPPLPPAGRPRLRAAGSGMPTGLVTTWLEEKGFGFIAPDDASLGDLFVHVSELRDARSNALTRGDRVRFEVKYNREKGKNLAIGVTVERNAADRGGRRGDRGDSRSRRKPSRSRSKRKARSRSSRSRSKRKARSRSGSRSRSKRKSSRSRSKKKARSASAGSRSRSPRKAKASRSRSKGRKRSSSSGSKQKKGTDKSAAKKRKGSSSSSS
ncbi:unnamed protein product [Prorocentrum cordatum]|uniref:CSD domain-containing protein n=1 Tax=Prorocentrum cordatum TaxID=2364126 RepID=A0ABN9TSY6_9DINO|nr:unnamed protein product [Polarella glacialis]